MSVKIIHPNENNPIIIPSGEIVGCLITWINVFMPNNDYRTFPIPRYATRQGLDKVLEESSHKILSLDIILRVIADHHRTGTQIRDTAQATLEFIDVNNLYFKNHQAISINGNTVEGIILTQNTLSKWFCLSRSERLKLIGFGYDRLNWLLKTYDINTNEG